MPMPGTWVGAAGIKSFFGAVGSFFEFGLCDNELPAVVALNSGANGPAMAYATWRECSTLRATATMPCTYLTNQALYSCEPAPANASALLISSITVNLDNLCVANAVCMARQVGADADHNAARGAQLASVPGLACAALGDGAGASRP